MFLHIKYLVYTKTTAGVAGGGRGGGCNLHSRFLPQQVVASQTFGKLLNLGLAAGMVQGSQQRCYHPVSSSVCWLHHPISSVVFLPAVGQ